MLVLLIQDLSSRYTEILIMEQSCQYLHHNIGNSNSYRVGDMVAVAARFIFDYSHTISILIQQPYSYRY